jgi:hypothetical protein
VKVLSVQQMAQLKALGYTLYADVRYGRVPESCNYRDLWKLEAVRGHTTVVLLEKATWSEYLATVKTWLAMNNQDRKAA